MNVLVIGGGGREHAICVKLNNSPRVERLFAIPGNAGMAQICECHGDIDVRRHDLIVDFIRQNAIDYTVVAPDNPLADGLVDSIEAAGGKAFGPTKAAAEIESSKSFSKQLMKKYNIPTAEYEEFDDVQKALLYVDRAQKFPLVVKADGLAYGKGVIICQDHAEARAAVEGMMAQKRFGSSGDKVIIEEFLQGREVTVLCFIDGNTILPMESSQDHKRVFDGDRGDNTGGMGTFSPSGFYDDGLSREVYSRVLVPTMQAMNAEGRKFKGVLYVGLMIDGRDIKVLEYNARFGDPETQVVLPRLKNDLLDVFLAVTEERLKDITLEWEKGACVCVMLASRGYPQSAQKGVEIDIGKLSEDIMLFHSGTERSSDGKLVTAGGRVLGVTAKGTDIEDARKKVYSNIKNIHFDGMHYRSDIGGQDLGNQKAKEKYG